MDVKLFLIVMVAVIPLDGVIESNHQGPYQASKVAPMGQLDEEAINKELEAIKGPMKKAYVKARDEAFKELGNWQMVALLGQCGNGPQEHAPVLDSLACVFMSGSNMQRLEGDTEGTTQVTDKDEATFNEIVQKLKRRVIDLLTQWRTPVPWSAVVKACAKMERTPSSAFMCSVAQQHEKLSRRSMQRTKGRRWNCDGQPCTPV